MAQVQMPKKDPGDRKDTSSTHCEEMSMGGCHMAFWRPEGLLGNQNMDNRRVIEN